MNSLLLNLSSVVAFVLAGNVAIFVATQFSRPSELDAIPIVGPHSWLGSWWAGLKFLINGIDIIQEGYKKHKSAPFRVARLHHWMVVVGNRKHVEELWRAPDDVLSFTDAINDELQFEHALSPEFLYNYYHSIPVIRSQLTRNLGVLYPDIRNEITTAFEDILDLQGNEWKSVTVSSCVQQVVCRTSNRVFVGLPLCRDRDWVDLNIRYTIDVVKGGPIIRIFPKLLKPTASCLFTGINRGKQCARELLRPIIEERRKCLNEYGNGWADKPNDLLSWLMEEGKGPELTVESLAIRMLGVNFAAIHTSSLGITDALIRLAANPQYIQPLREEIEGIVDKEGWSKSTLGKMHKVDSFLRECHRIEGFSAIGVTRKALKDFMFSDGTRIPRGTTVTAAIRCIHHDEQSYEDPDAFKPFRFADMQEGPEGSKHQFASTSTEYLPFGHGRHACPGRFFAANELKTMLAHVVTTYDIKLGDSTAPPHSLRFDTAIFPDPHRKVLFRRRVD